MTTYRWSFTEDAIGYSQAGFRSIGVWRNKLVEFGVERGNELLRERDLTVCSLSWAGGFTGTTGFSYDEALDDALEAIDQAATIGARCVMIAVGGRGGHILSHVQRLVRSALRTLADPAAAAGVELAILPMRPTARCDWTYLHTLDATVELVEQIAHPAVRIGFDTFHMWREADLIGRIGALASKLAIVQIGDSRGEGDHGEERCLPGRGILPIGDVLHALIEAGYEREFEIQLWSERLWQEDYTQLIDQCRAGITGLPCVGC